MVAGVDFQILMGIAMAREEPVRLLVVGELKRGVVIILLLIAVAVIVQAHHHNHATPNLALAPMLLV
jgi:hypothetical protein